MFILVVLRKLYTFLIDIMQTLLLVASFGLVVYVFFLRPFQVNGQSMHPYLQDKEYVLTNLISLRFEDPKRGDIVVFKAPDDEEKDFIKRVIGMPFDTVMIKEGYVYINGERLGESGYLPIDLNTYGGSFLREEQTVTIPEHEYFVLGDNRPFSSDSREWGFIKRTEIIGESFFVYWPPSHAKFIKNPYEE